jgi:hypothetical protein
MVELESRLREKGCLKYYLIVTPENDDAIEFYLANGCEEMSHQLLGKEL